MAEDVSARTVNLTVEVSRPRNSTLWLCHLDRIHTRLQGQPAVCMLAQCVNGGEVPFDWAAQGSPPSKDSPATPVPLVSSLIGPCWGERLRLNGCLLGGWEEGLVTLGIVPALNGATASLLWKLAHSFAFSLVKAGSSFRFAEPPPQPTWLTMEPIWAKGHYSRSQKP